MLFYKLQETPSTSPNPKFYQQQSVTQQFTQVGMRWFRRESDAP